VVSVGDKIEIELAGGQTKRVRPKDVEVLHPGPLRALAELQPLGEGALQEAWELLEGGETTLRELAELAFDTFTPASAWATWQQVAEGLAFSGSPARIQVRERAAVERERAERDAKAAAERDWQAFLERMAEASPAPEDAPRLFEIERLALAQSERSRILDALGYAQTPESAHRALLKVGHWPAHHNPHPQRCGAALDELALEVAEALPEEPRLDLTHLAAYAIDDAESEDPDDAISLDGERIWVHVADVGALVAPDSTLDREARARGANLYLPERMITMLPRVLTDRLGLGLQAVSPALSFAFACDAAGELREIEVHRSWVRVERLSYDAAEQQLDEEPFASLRALIGRFRARRERLGATRLALPEVSVRLDAAGRVCIRPLGRLASRELVTDAMLMAGEAAARLCLEQGIAIPFATQAAPEPGEEGEDLASMYARRRCFKPTRLLGEPEPHAGLGLPLYTRATSPLRRYSDLLVHQQLRAWLDGRDPLGRDALMARTAEAETAALTARRSERLSNLHWKLVYLRENPRWRGEAVVVGREERKAVLLLPELALETRVRTRDPVELNAALRVEVGEVDLPDLTANFRLLG